MHHNFMINDLESRIDRVINKFVPISSHGCSALIWSNGNTVYSKSVGRIDEFNFIYSNETIYDLASLTKPLVTSLLMLKLIDKGEISLNDSIGDLQILRDYKNISKLTIGNLMSHKSGLIPDKPLYEIGRDKESYLKGIEVEAEKASQNKYELYSDLNYILLGFVLEEIYDAPLDLIWNREIKTPLGLESAGFNPVIPKERIAPSEVSPERGLLWGKVNDEKSYYLGGVAGHAGLFSNTNDILKIMIALIKGHILSNRTLTLATSNQNKHLGGMFGLGWMTKTHQEAKKSESFDLSGFFGDFAPEGTFGHTGFTGTSICANIKMKLVCILLTNRTYPTRANISNIVFRRHFHNNVFLTFPDA